MQKWLHKDVKTVTITCEICGKTRNMRESAAIQKGVLQRTCSIACSLKLYTSSIEVIMQERMLAADLSPVPQYLIEWHYADFAFPEQRLVIECDGDYWHSPAKNKGQDKKVDAYLAKLGWRVIRLWEHQIRKSPDECLQIILDALKG
jgi:very-short-patch-repair endonuclease